MTPTQEARFVSAKREADFYGHSVAPNAKHSEYLFLAGYALGAQERQAQDAVEPKRTPFRVFDDRAWPLARAAYELGASGAPATDAERDLFEAWMRGHCWQCGEWDGQSYSDMTTRVLWAAWRDRAALTTTEPA